ncbi:alpha/beta hydrolase [Catalinimonas sp. 4WD22]|uniref:alpha/beta hydrolase n=1 Tax=Catalinimonas locisalis TaxID=3133978 RepID=UPI0031012956
MKKRIWIPSLIILALLIAYLVGPIPPNPTYSEVWPELPYSLTKLEKYIKSTEAKHAVRKNNQARILWHNNTPQLTEYSFVYLHGFAGSYRDGYPLNVSVADTFNANIYLSRWVGHGLKPSVALKNFSAEAAWKSAKEALAIGRRIGRKVIVMSTSTGGTLALKLAATYPDSVFALINISPNIRDDAFGAFLLNSPWGYEIAHLAALGEHRKVRHEKEIATQYWDTIYPAEALLNLQVLVSSTMHAKTFNKIDCPMLTLYYYKNFLLEDEHVEVDRYPEVYQALSTPDSLLRLIALGEPGTHFIGSSIKSKNWRSAQQEIILFCRQTLGMPVLADSSSQAF